MEQLVRVEGNRGPVFTAGFVYDDTLGRCVRAAPILKYLIGKSAERIREIGQKQHWKMTVVRQP